MTIRSLLLPLGLGAVMLSIAACSGSAADESVDKASADTEVTKPATANTSSSPEASASKPKQKANIAKKKSNSPYRELSWEELMPEGEEERIAEMYQQQMAMLYSAGPIAEGSAADKAFQIGTFNVVPELNGQKIRLPGYTVPFQYGPNAEITEFLLVPYFGACLHAPPPPPNQTIFVMTAEPIRISDLAQAVWVEGTLKTEVESTELADTAYTIIMDNIEEYSY